MAILVGLLCQPIIQEGNEKVANKAGGSENAFGLSASGFDLSAAARKSILLLFPCRHPGNQHLSINSV